MKNADGMDKAFGLPNPPTAEQNQKQRTLMRYQNRTNLTRYRQT